jgi:DNA-binding response OmpR family regulator
MFAGPTRQIIVADGNPSRLGWLVKALRDAGHAVFPVSDGEGVISVARTLGRVDLLIASRETPTVSGHPFDQLIKDRLGNVAVVYWDPTRRTSPSELEQLLSN